MGIWCWSFFMDKNCWFSFFGKLFFMDKKCWFPFLENCLFWWTKRADFLLWKKETPMKHAEKLKIWLLFLTPRSHFQVSMLNTSPDQIFRVCKDACSSQTSGQLLSCNQSLFLLLTSAVAATYLAILARRDWRRDSSFGPYTRTLPFPASSEVNSHTLS